MTVSASPSPKPRFTLHQSGVPEDDFARDVATGLTRKPKSIPPRWFYDDLGSALFDAICFLPEYYVLRAETEILTTHADEIADALGSRVRVIELGSGTARKTRILLDCLTERQSELEYVPVDIDATLLDRTGRDLLNEYGGLRVTAISSDFARPSVPLRKAGSSRERSIVLFLGSSIGNLSPDAAVAMLRDLRSSLRNGDALFLGADLRKDRSVLEAAYDDSLGVTAAFNLNILARINRELDGNFALATFRHHAFYDEEHGRVEMHLVSTQPQSVRIEALDLDVKFAAGESIHTENSHKYDDATLATLAQNSGFSIEKKWTDRRGWFADVLMVAD